MIRNRIYIVALLAAFAVACENKGFDGEPEDPYSQSGGEQERITADTIWLKQFTVNRGVRSTAVINETGDTVEYASFHSDGRPDVYLSGRGGVRYEFDGNGRPSVVYTLEGSSVFYYTLEYKNDADLLVPVYDNLGPGLYNLAAIHADDSRHFSILAGLSKVTKRSSDQKVVQNRKYVYVDDGKNQWMKVYTENQATGGGTEVDRIEYKGKFPTHSDSLSIDTVIFKGNRLLDSYRYHYTGDNGAVVYETCTFRTHEGYLYPKSTVQEGGETREYRYSSQGNLESVVIGDNPGQEYSATYEYDSSGNWTKMQFNGLSFSRNIEYY